jgi:hypothetical protein
MNSGVLYVNYLSVTKYYQLKMNYYWRGEGKDREVWEKWEVTLATAVD